MRTVFMGTPDFAVPTLDSLVLTGHQVVAVYTQPDRPAGRGRSLISSPVKRKALQLGLTVQQPPSFRQPEEVQKLTDLRPEVIVVAAFGQLLPQSVLDIPPFGCLNVHPSLLPRHRGPTPVVAAILAGDEVTGVTIMLLDRGMDTGPLLAQEKVKILPQDTTGSLTANLAQAGARLLMQILPLWLEGKIAPQPQDNEKATYSEPLTKEGGRIDWRLPAVELWRRVRAFQPWPGCYTMWQGKVLKVIEAVPLPGAGEVGRVVAIQGSQSATIGVQAGEGILGLLQLQLEGKRVMAAADFVRGQRDFVGALLTS
jgi:methionyl-tRNA formyltransferase